MNGRMVYIFRCGVGFSGCSCSLQTTPKPCTDKADYTTKIFVLKHQNFKVHSTVTFHFCHTHWIICRGSRTNLVTSECIKGQQEHFRRNVQYIVTVCVIQTHTCLGGLNGLPVVTRAFGSTERGESGVLPGRDLSTFVPGRTLTNLQHRTKEFNITVSCNQRKYKPEVPNGSVIKVST